LAYQPTAPKVARLAELRKKFSDITFSCLVDNPSTAETLSERFADDPLPVFLDLNVGMHRTGVLPEAAPLLYERCQALSGIRVVGIHAYDGHIHAADVRQRKQEADAAFALVGQVLNVITPHQGNALTLVVGGSPTFPFHARREGVECSPGTFPLWDAGYATAFPDLEFMPAALLLSRVISVIDGQQLCLDVGSKAVAADAAWPRLVFPDHPEAEALRQSEEHLVVRVPDTAATRVGDAWWGIPLHICPTVNLYESLHVVQDHRWTENWEVTARQRKITI
jgi:D-serine deaminase-like pyridoxal phosphate-dependent protein